MANKYDNEFMSTGKEVNEIASSLRAGKNNSNKGKGKKKLIILLLLIIFLVVGAGAAVVIMMLSNSKTNVEFYGKNVDAGVKVWCDIYDTTDNTSQRVLVDGKEELTISFEPELPNNESKKVITFENSKITSKNSIIQFFYEIENRSDVADMYVNYQKENSNDTNFVISIFYRIGEGNDVVALTYYAFEGMYYYSEVDIMNGTNAMEEISLNSDIVLEKNTKMTMRIELQVFDENKDASCNCDFNISLINIYNNGASGK